MPDIKQLLRKTRQPIRNVTKSPAIGGCPRVNQVTTCQPLGSNTHKPVTASHWWSNHPNHKPVNQTPKYHSSCQTLPWQLMVEPHAVRGDHGSPKFWKILSYIHKCVMTEDVWKRPLSLNIYIPKSQNMYVCMYLCMHTLKWSYKSIIFFPLKNLKSVIYSYICSQPYDY